jgi:hypothetical protein
MEMNESSLTLLTPDGEFLQAKRQDIAYSIGEEIYFFPIIVDSAKRKWLVSFKNSFKLKSIWKPVTALIIFISAVIPIYQSNQAYAYMSIDAESSIELGLNKKMQVVEINGFNDDTEKIIAGIEGWKKSDVAEVTKILIAELKDEGIITAEEPVVISTVKTKQIDEKVETRLEQNIQEIKQGVVDQKIKVNEYTTTKEELEKALASGVSVGKYHKRKTDSELKKQLKEKSKAERFGKEQNNNVPSTPAKPDLSNQNNGPSGWGSENEYQGKLREEKPNIPKVQQEENEKKGREQWKDDRQKQADDKNQNQRQNQGQNQGNEQRQQEHKVNQEQYKNNEQPRVRGNENSHNQQWQSKDKNKGNNNRRE